MKFFIIYVLLSLIFSFHLKIESSISNSIQLGSVFGYEKNLVIRRMSNDEDIDNDLNTGTHTIKTKKKDNQIERDLPNKEIFDIQNEKVINPKKNETEVPTNTNDTQLKDNQLQFEGKYFMLTKDNPKNINKKFKNIAGNEMFNFTLNNNNTLIISYKNNILDSIPFSTLYNVELDNTNKLPHGGIENIGRYTEGTCFSLHGKGFKCVICHNDKREKEILNSIVRTRIIQQKQCLGEKKKEEKPIVQKIIPVDDPPNTTTTMVNNNITYAIQPQRQVLTKYLRPIIKAVYITKEPQQYQKCIIKAKDVNIYYPAQKVKVPSRITMIRSSNTFNITNLFYSKTFPISSILYYDIYPEDERCVQIGCPYDSSTNYTIFCVCDASEANQWLDDIAMFKSNCTEDATSKRKLKLAKTLAQEKLEKEEKIEKLMEEEIRQQGEQKLKKMKQMIEREKLNLEQRKLQKITKINKENSIKRKNEIVDKKIKEIEMQLNNELEEKRIKNRKRLKKLNIEQQIRLSKLEEEYNDIKGKEIMIEKQKKKKGNREQCFNHIYSQPDYIEQYCDNAYTNHKKFLGICLQKENFCFMCCHNEYEEYSQEREDCFNQCVEIDNTINEEDINSMLSQSEKKNIHIINKFYN